MTLTLLDAGVLIVAARGGIPSATRSLAVLADPERTFALSIFVRLEVEPKAAYSRREPEVQFYER